MDKTKKIKQNIQRAIQLVKYSIDEKPFYTYSISELSTAAGINRNSMQQEFKLLYCMSIKRYQLQARMEAAARMLDYESYSIKQVAAICGYKSQANFSIAFRKVFNTTPTQWRVRVA